MRCSNCYGQIYRSSPGWWYHTSPNSPIWCFDRISNLENYARPAWETDCVGCGGQVIWSTSIGEWVHLSGRCPYQNVGPIQETATLTCEFCRGPVRVDPNGRLYHIPRDRAYSLNSCNHDPQPVTIGRSVAIVNQNTVQVEPVSLEPANEEIILLALSRLSVDRPDLSDRVITLVEALEDTSDIYTDALITFTRLKEEYQKPENKSTVRRIRLNT